MLNKISNLIGKGRVKLDLGCGSSKKTGYIGVDQIQYPGVDLCGDIYDILKSIPSGSCSEVRASHFICHLSNWEIILSECYRLLEENGDFVVINPHFSNPYFFSDPTHVKSSGLYSMSYYAHDDIFSRKVPLYFDTGFTLHFVGLEFKASKPFYLSYAFGYIFNIVFNAMPIFQEIYEWHFSKILNCYQIKYILKKLK